MFFSNSYGLIKLALILGYAAKFIQGINTPCYLHLFTHHTPQYRLSTASSSFQKSLSHQLENPNGSQNDKKEIVNRCTDDQLRPTHKFKTKYIPQNRIDRTKKGEGEGERKGMPDGRCNTTGQVSNPLALFTSGSSHDARTCSRERIQIRGGQRNLHDPGRTSPVITDQRWQVARRILISDVAAHAPSHPHSRFPPTDSSDQPSFLHLFDSKGPAWLRLSGFLSSLGQRTCRFFASAYFF